MPDESTMKLSAQRRSFEVDRAAINENDRTVELSFSSEYPVKRWWGTEILDHGRGSMRTERLKTGAPLLLNHDRDEQVGVVESVTIGADRKGRAVVRFGKGAQADEIFRDVIDGIRRLVSVDYIIHKLRQEDSTPEDPIFRAMDWEPLEISIVSVPADPTVGVGRAEESNDYTVLIESRSEKMEDENKTEGKPDMGKATPATPVSDQRALEDVRNEAREKEQARVRDIFAIGEQHNARELVDKAIKAGSSVDDFRRELLESKYGQKSKPLPDNAAAVGISEQEARQYSLFRAIRAHIDKDWSDAGFERECSRAVAEKLGRAPEGFFVPYEALAVGKRDYLSYGLTNHTGEKVVATDLLTGSFIDLLRNKMLVRQMGATILSGLVGNVAIPKQTGGATASWVAEDGNASDSLLTLAQVTMSPKTVTGVTQITRKLLQQSSMDVEMMVREDLAAVLALAMDLAALHGTGSNNQPTGIAATSGIGSVAGGDNGLAPAWSHLVQLETEVAVDNADIGTLGYLTNTKVRGKLKQTFINTTGGDTPLWKDGADGMGLLNGYRAGVTNQVSSALTKGTSSGVCSAIFFGNWRDLIIGLWGGLDIMADPYSGSSSGRLKLVAFQDCDIAVRHAESFAAMLDALTA